MMYLNLVAPPPLCRYNNRAAATCNNSRSANDNNTPTRSTCALALDGARSLSLSLSLLVALSLNLHLYLRASLLLARWHAPARGPELVWRRRPPLLRIEQEAGAGESVACANGSSAAQRERERDLKVPSRQKRCRRRRPRFTCAAPDAREQAPRKIGKGIEQRTLLCALPVW